MRPATPDDGRVAVRDPGLYDVPELEYHADRETLSSTMLKHVLRAPAYLRHYLDTERVEKPAFDFGHTVHALVLGVGLGFEVIDAGSWRTKAAQEARDEAYADGRVPMLAHEYERAEMAADAVRNHELAGQILAAGRAEVSAYAIDPDTGIPLRARIDWTGDDGYLYDLKTARTGEPFAFERAGRGWGHEVQAAHYCHVYQLATRRRPTGYRLITVETNAPHLVDVHEPPDWAEIGEAKRKLGTALYADCLAHNHWPGRPAVINRIASPDWELPEEEIE